MNVLVCERVRVCTFGVSFSLTDFSIAALVAKMLDSMPEKLQLRSYYLWVLCPAGDLDETIQEGTHSLNLRES